MNSLYLLIPIAFTFIALAAWLFFWAVDHDQFDDLDHEGQRILFDDDKPKLDKKDNEKEKDKNVDTNDE
jgi:cbb3-type cytochrome oxidase maturation protein